jgi:hypothetical protein
MNPPEKNFVLNLRQPTRESIKSEKNFLKCSSQMIDDVITGVEQISYIYILITLNFMFFLENFKNQLSIILGFLKI